MAAPGFKVRVELCERCAITVPMKSASASIRPHGSLQLRDVPGKGRGVFATRAFRRGEEVLEFRGVHRDVSAFADLTHALQIGPKTFISPSGDIDDFVNHSCDPNTGIRDVKGRIVLFALKDIKDGDEINFDYATTQAGRLWRIDCLCGTRKCRKFVGDFDELPPDVQAYYIKEQAVLPFLVPT